MVNGRKNELIPGLEIKCGGDIAEQLCSGRAQDCSQDCNALISLAGSFVLICFFGGRDGETEKERERERERASERTYFVT